MAEREELWQRVVDGISATPGALSEETRRAISRGEDPPELAALLAKVRHRAYAIDDADVAGLDDDVVVEAALAAALGVSLARRGAALAAVEGV